VEAESIEKINNSKLSQREIKDLIGTPTYIPEYSPDTWYYIQRSMSRRAWFDPKVVEQKIIKITFDSNHIATHAELITNSQKESIVLHNDFTKSNGTEKNGLQKFVGNIGKFNKTTNGKKNKQKR
jgi:outer membrane protein assembly factor BamE (lipoprotein component of BamABCDE complex)